jgi:transcription antitermination factor NusG
MLQLCEGRWLAVQVRTNAEYAVSAALRSKGYQVFLPTYRCTKCWSDRVKEIAAPLFAGYVFCRFSAAIQPRIVGTPGLIRILGVGNTPVPVHDAEIEALEALVAAKGIHMYPWPNLETGTKVRIVAGPLRGLVGVLCAVKNTHVFAVSVGLLRRSVLVEIEAQWIEPLADGDRPVALPVSSSDFVTKNLFSVKPTGTTVYS